MGQVMRAEMIGNNIEVSLNSLMCERFMYDQHREMRYFVRVSFIDERGVPQNLVRTDMTPLYHQALHTYEEHCRLQAIRLAEQALDLSPIKPAQSRT